MIPAGTASTRRRRLRDGLEPIARHGELFLVLGLASVLRVLVDRHAVPGVYQDSLVYLKASPHAPFGPYSPTRPSGYPLILRILDVLPGQHLNTVTWTQHLAGVVVGALVYFLVVRAGGRRWLAIAAASIVVVEVYTVALEQSILAESTFTLALAASAYLTLRRPAALWSIVAGGLLLGMACTVRSVGTFAVPVWTLWLVLSRPGRRVAAAGLAAVAFPVLGYATLHAAEGAGFSLQGSDGWFLYAKIGPIVDCRGASIAADARPLCVPPAPGKEFEHYLYEGDSPAYQLFHGGQAVNLEEAVTPENNRILRRFSVAVIRAHPTDFVRLVVREVRRYLGPSTAQNELSLYGQPGTLLQRYERSMHMRWWMVTGAFAAGLAGVVLGRRIRELTLLFGLAAALVTGAAATSGFNNRYLVPTFPLLAAAAALAVDEAVGLVRRRGRAPAGDPADP